MRDKLLEYKTGMKQQLADAKRQLHMIEGALQFCEQLIAEFDEEGEKSPSDEEHDDERN